ncbi:MAG: hypothetical protein E5V89_31395 [Mesorhizobium sp.]|nr:MAG: hypothetical protein E5V89_31395 [Mesorhizobium sp.]
MRLFAFVAIAGFMIAGPVAEQVLGVQTAGLRSWTMFSAIGMGVIDASFEIRQPDGTLVPLDRFELLGARRDVSAWRCCSGRAGRDSGDAAAIADEEQRCRDEEIGGEEQAGRRLVPIEQQLALDGLGRAGDILLFRLPARA